MLVGMSICRTLSPETERVAETWEVRIGQSDTTRPETRRNEQQQQHKKKKKKKKK